ncbi:MAG: P27 family phage terminase small subunit [Chloroflexi bacterium]|nr:MAG: P27 family phage terminase small subunit [Chloroflexota bacterium]
MGGTTGRARKPVAAMRAAGTANETRLKKQGRTDGPRLVRGIPVPPPGLNAAAQLAYYQYANQFNERGILSLSHGMALVMLVHTHLEYEQAQAKWQELGEPFTYTDSKGRVKSHPLPREIRSLRKELFAALGKFGATPATQERVSPIPIESSDDPNDPWNKLEERRN